ncbi:MAG: tetratricopeptide repeat protein [Bacteroidales bacterium]
MKNLSKIIFILILFAAACSGSRQLTELSNNATKAYQEEDYAAALQLYEEFISQHSNDVAAIPDSIYSGAGLSAYHLGQSEKALNYLNLIRHSETADADAHYILAKLNREIDNLSREITAIEMFLEKQNEGKKADAMKQRLFVTYTESRNYEKAFNIWEEIESKVRNDEDMLNRFFHVNQALENESRLDDIAEDLLLLNPDNTDALSHMAEKYFWRAENRYQSEMEAYEKNRTHRQYAQLLRAFEVLNADFHKSLNYFLRLYKKDPKPEYARFIGNIYLRFDDKSKARYYHSKAEE